MLVRVLLDWFEDEVDASPPSWVEGFLRLAGVDRLPDIQFLTRTPSGPGTAARPFPSRWDCASPPLAARIDELLESSDGEDVVLIVLSSETAPPHASHPRLPAHDLDCVGAEVGCSLADLRPGLCWVSVANPHVAHLYQPDDVRAALAEYWLDRLGEKWEGLSHGGTADIVNEGLGCIRALLVAQHSQDTPGPIRRHCRHTLNDTMQADDDSLADGPVGAEPHLLPALRRWQGCEKKLIEAIYPIARAMHAGGSPMSVGLQAALTRRIEHLAPTPGLSLVAEVHCLLSHLDTLHRQLGKGHLDAQDADSIWQLFLLSTLLRWRAFRAGRRNARFGQGRRHSEDTASLLELQDTPDGCRLLVVDDTPTPWVPLFHVIRNSLGPDLQLSIDFSLDGKTILSEGTGVPVESRLHWYDAVLMDVRFPNSASAEARPTDEAREVPHQAGRAALWERLRYGLTRAHEIKRNRPTLPILLWSSSDDPSLLRDRGLSEGFFVKKSLEVHRLVEDLGGLIRRCHDLREVQLLDPGFNEAIANPKLRRLCQSVSEQAMDSLGAFYALDESYFRYFSDHGTKHSIRVAENMRLLFASLFPLPSVGGEHNDSRFWTNGRLTEWSVALLYAAAFAHDMGYFPDESNQPSGAESGENAAQRRKTDHALFSAEWVRNTLALSDQNGDGKSFRDDLALVCLAHWDRVTPSASEPETFEIRDGTDALAAERYLEWRQVATLAPNWSHLAVLGKMIALAEALDCDRRRVPPSFIRSNDTAAPHDYAHWLSHLVVERREISRGAIAVHFVASEEAPGRPECEHLRSLEAQLRRYWDSSHGDDRYLWHCAQCCAKSRLRGAWDAFKIISNAHDDLFRNWEFRNAEVDWRVTQTRPEKIPNPRPAPDIDVWLGPAAARTPIEDKILLPRMYPGGECTIRPLAGGCSGSRVYLIAATPGNEFTPRVVKTDRAQKVREELTRYTECVVHNVSAKFLIGHAHDAEFRGRGAYAGALVGGGSGISDLVDILQSGDMTLLTSVIDRVLKEVLWCSTEPAQSLSLAGDRHRFGVDYFVGKRLREAQAQLAGIPDERKPNSSATDLEALRYDLTSQGRLLDEIGGIQAWVHGDLNWRNVLVETVAKDPKPVYLIDYANFGPGPFMSDLAKLESDLVLYKRPPTTDAEADDLLDKLSQPMDLKRLKDLGEYEPALTAIRRIGKKRVEDKIWRPMGPYQSIKPVAMWAMPLIDYYLRALKYDIDLEEAPAVTKRRLSLALRMARTYARLLTS